MRNIMRSIGNGDCNTRVSIYPCIPSYCLGLTFFVQRPLATPIPSNRSFTLSIDTWPIRVRPTYFSRQHFFCTGSPLYQLGEPSAWKNMGPYASYLPQPPSLHSSQPISVCCPFAPATATKLMNPFSLQPPPPCLSRIAIGLRIMDVPLRRKIP
jgi:hypothetical protein